MVDFIVQLLFSVLSKARVWPCLLNLRYLFIYLFIKQKFLQAQACWKILLIRKTWGFLCDASSKLNTHLEKNEFVFSAFFYFWVFFLPLWFMKPHWGQGGGSHYGFLWRKKWVIAAKMYIIACNFLLRWVYVSKCDWVQPCLLLYVAAACSIGNHCMWQRPQEGGEGAASNGVLQQQRDGEHSSQNIPLIISWVLSDLNINWMREGDCAPAWRPSVLSFKIKQRIKLLNSKWSYESEH